MREEEKVKPREFTLWFKRDKDLPGAPFKISEKPHRDCLIGYEEIDVIEVINEEKEYGTSLRSKTKRSNERDQRDL